MTTPNIPAIRKLLTQIESDPQSFDMLDWEGYRGDGDDYWNPEEGEWAERTECGTTRCAAGWAIYQYADEHDLHHPDRMIAVTTINVGAQLGIPKPDRSYSGVGSRILGIESSWFYAEPGDLIDHLRGLVRSSE